MKKRGNRGLSLLLCAALAAAVLPLSASAKTGFTDVPENAWYAPAVKYVEENGLMNGNGDGTFSPNKPMTRAMFVQVLYNMTDRPENDGEWLGSGQWFDFSDVPYDEWYSVATKWAYRSGVAEGAGKNRFEPNRAVTREQAAQFLYRYAQRTENDLFGYPDKSPPVGMDASSWAWDAVTWAWNRGILRGDETGWLRCQKSATRAEVAQMLSKAAPLLEKRVMAPFSRASETAGNWGLTAENYPRVDGSTSTLQLVQDAFWRMHTCWNEAAYPAEASRTVPSYEKLIAGEADLILVPYASSDVLAQAKAEGVELEFHKLALEALVFITQKDNSTENLTEQQAVSIYRDYSIRNWKEVGGPDELLSPFCRNADSGSQSQMDNLILKGQPMHQEIQDNYMELTMPGMLNQLWYYGTGLDEHTSQEGYPLGYTLFAYFKQAYPKESETKLKMLSYNGVAPTEESLKDGSYPLTDGYYAVLRKDTPQDAPARKLLSWYLSEDGARNIRYSGFLPAN